MKEDMSVELQFIMGKFKAKMKEVEDMMSPIKDRYEVEIDPNFDIEKLKSEYERAFAILSRYKNVEILSEEQLGIISRAELYMEAINDRVVELGGKPFKIKGIKETNEEVKETNEEVKETAENMDVITVKARASSSGLSNTFGKATKSLKRFALSLFSIRSLWSMLSRATRTYMSENKDLQNTIKSLWVGIGTLMAPVVEFLANLFLKLLGYINVVTKALFNYDFIAKANAKTMENYAKKTKKASQALSGLDEIQNLQQQNGDDDEGPALIKTPELNEGLVKKLQDLSYWLKDNWDWLKKVLEVIGLVFGVKAVAGWLSGIGNLIGGSGTGLLGLAAAFIVVYDAIKYKELYDEWKALEKYQKELNKWQQDIHSQYVQGAKDKKKEARSYEVGSQKTAQYIGMLESNVSMNKSRIDSGKLSVSQYKREAEEIQVNIDLYKDLYENGKLTTEQIKDYANFMADLGLKIDGTKMSVKDYTTYQTILKSGTKDASDKARDFASQINGIGITTDNTKTKSDNLKTSFSNTFAGSILGAISTFGTTVKNNVNGAFDSGMSAADAFGGKLKGIFGKKYTAELEAKLGAIDANTFKNTWNGFVDRTKETLNRMIPGVNLGKLLKLPYLSIGTDKVKSEGLAYLHAGESVVPADVVGGGYSGGNNNETNGLLRDLIEVVRSKDFNATISSDDVGRASVDYIRNQNRLMGGSII